MASVHHARRTPGPHVAGEALTSIRVGTAGWALPKALRARESAGETVLEHYAMLFNAVEINSSFYRPHRRSTYERWSASVPESFRFSVKIPRMITHELGLSGCQYEIASFMNGARGLGDKLATLLVQLPPSRTFDEVVARTFFRMIRHETAVHIACEARSPSWFVREAADLFDEYQITRVAADPVPPGCECAARQNSRVAYIRLHGSPKVYYSAYSESYLHDVAAVALVASETWCILDNTAAGAAWSDAATLQRLIGASAVPG
jgi:uncharacterized protein YecE (DUF72 family)